MADAKKPIVNEIATTAKDIDVFFGWLTRLENPDPVLRTEAAGKGLKLYDEAARDPHAACVLQSRYLAIAGCEWEVEPGDESAKAREIADFVLEALRHTNLTQALQELMQAALYGFFCGRGDLGPEGRRLGSGKNHRQTSASFFFRHGPGPAAAHPGQHD